MFRLIKAGETAVSWFYFRGSFMGELRPQTFTLSQVLLPTLLLSIRRALAGMGMSIPNSTPPPSCNCGAQPTRSAGTHSTIPGGATRSLPPTRPLDCLCGDQSTLSMTLSAFWVFYFLFLFINRVLFNARAASVRVNSQDS